MNYMTVITRDNFREIPDVVAHCVDTGIASIYLMNVYGDTAGTSLLTVAEIGEFRDEVVPAILAVLRDKHTPEVVQTNAAYVLGTFFSRENPDENYARGVYWPDADSVRQSVPGAGLLHADRAGRAGVAVLPGRDLPPGRGRQRHGPAAGRGVDG